MAVGVIDVGVIDVVLDMVPGPPTTFASQHVEYTSVLLLKAQCHWNVYIPGAIVTGMENVPVQSDLESRWLQKLGQF